MPTRLSTDFSAVKLQRAVRVYIPTMKNIATVFAIVFGKVSFKGEAYFHNMLLLQQGFTDSATQSKEREMAKWT